MDGFTQEYLASKTFFFIIIFRLKLRLIMVCQTPTAHQICRSQGRNDHQKELAGGLQGRCFSLSVFLGLNFNPKH